MRHGNASLTNLQCLNGNKPQSWQKCCFLKGWNNFKYNSSSLSHTAHIWLLSAWCSSSTVSSCPFSTPPLTLVGDGSETCSSSIVAKFCACSSSKSLRSSGSDFATSSGVCAQSLSFFSASGTLASSAGLPRTGSPSPFSVGLNSSHGDRASAKVCSSSPADLLCCLVGGRLLNDSRARVCVGIKTHLRGQNPCKSQRSHAYGSDPIYQVFLAYMRENTQQNGASGGELD